MSEETPQPVSGQAWQALLIGFAAFPAFWVLFSFLKPESVLAIALFGGLGWFVGASTPESKNVMRGVLGALLMWSAVSFAAWQLWLWNLAREYPWIDPWIDRFIEDLEALAERALR